MCNSSHKFEERKHCNSLGENTENLWSHFLQFLVIQSQPQPKNIEWKIQRNVQVTTAIGLQA
jgi:hypothetical protein